MFVQFPPASLLIHAS